MLKWWFILFLWFYSRICIQSMRSPAVFGSLVDSVQQTWGFSGASFPTVGLPILVVFWGLLKFAQFWLRGILFWNSLCKVDVLKLGDVRLAIFTTILNRRRQYWIFQGRLALSCFTLLDTSLLNFNFRVVSITACTSHLICHTILSDLSLVLFFFYVLPFSC